MCGIAGIHNANNQPYVGLEPHLRVMGKLIEHRGPDDRGIWSDSSVGFAHQRLSIIDIEHGKQPMSDTAGNTICFNGELYNFVELREKLNDSYSFKTNSDTEVILAAYAKWGKACLDHFRGMFAFAIWDSKNKELFCARDHFGIKPFYYMNEGTTFFFASEVKALLPFMEDIETDQDALQDYFVFQLYLDGKTLFKGVKELPPGHFISICKGELKVERYWEVYYDIDYNHTRKYFEENLKELIHDSMKLHIRSDVPIGSYVSGGIDSSIVGSLASRMRDDDVLAFTGKFSLGDLYDESEYARALTDKAEMDLIEKDIVANDFLNNIENVIYHLDYPVAGPGAFPQYMISETAAKHRKVVLGGQGGDEIFGGYTRYLIAYFEQCIKGAIDGTLKDGNFIVDYESIIPKLSTLKNYKPLMKQFFSKGMFGPLDERYYHLIDRAPSLSNEVNWEHFTNDYSPMSAFKKIFNGDNVGKESYFDKMTHFDFKTLLPGLLQVEDRMSMAHGLESRVPFLDKNIVEFAATMPADIKFLNGSLKMILVDSMKKELPQKILDRDSKMGFPVPFNDWSKKELKSMILDTIGSTRALNRDFINNDVVLSNLKEEMNFGRKLWGLFSLELWQQQFHDKHDYYKNLLKEGV